MKRTVFVLLAFLFGIVIGVLGFGLKYSIKAPLSPYNIAVLTPVSHPSLNEAIRGFKSKLTESGFGDTNITIYDAEGDTSKIILMIKTILNTNPNLVFSLTTPATSKAAKRIPQAGIPLVFTAVTDPVGAGILNNMHNCSLPITGVSDRYPVEEQMKFLKTLLPNIQSVGILRNPSEQNSKLLSEESHSQLKKIGISSTLIEVTSEAEIVIKVKEALNQHDCLLVNGDNLLVANLGKIIKLCSKAKVPLYVGDPDSVHKGALATVGPSYYSLGAQSGQQAISILKGTFAGDIPCELPTDFDYVINTVAADAMNVVLTSKALQVRTIWESKARN